jgi:hypothetical protein
MRAILAIQSAGMWAVLSMFSSIPAQLQNELNGDEIYRPENTITLSQIVHTEFDDLRIWFKPVDVCLRTRVMHID